MGEIAELGEKQVLVMFYRHKLKLSYTEIGRRMRTTKQNVHSMLKRIIKNYSSCKDLIEKVELLSNPYVKVSKGSNLLELTEEVMRVADENGIKLRGSKNDVVTWIKWYFDCDGFTVNEDGGIVIKREGILTKVSYRAIEEVESVLSKFV